ncbi:hypothetical protein [Spartinivicinus poritis]|uniref:Mobilization protein n=1 Tax=Spartinivicinus poritis TaxID=2994640 RepID=A0ABT5UE58_9GAMM|nr:hypothetical protein [Spartinivicinus sp. A2-2]MDE1464645.1 hypothetical protein [Spartinivicinus sp. A2-2]
MKIKNTPLSANTLNSTSNQQARPSNKPSYHNQRTIKLLSQHNSTFCESVFREGFHYQSRHLKLLKKEIKILQNKYSDQQRVRTESALALWVKQHPKEVSTRGQFINQLQYELREHKIHMAQSFIEERRKGNFKPQHSPRANQVNSYKAKEKISLDAFGYLNAFTTEKLGINLITHQRTAEEIKKQGIERRKTHDKLVQQIKNKYNINN